MAGPGPKIFCERDVVISKIKSFLGNDKSVDNLIAKIKSIDNNYVFYIQEKYLNLKSYTSTTVFPIFIQNVQNPISSIDSLAKLLSVGKIGSDSVGLSIGKKSVKFAKTGKKNVKSSGGGVQTDIIESSVIILCYFYFYCKSKNKPTDYNSMKEFVREVIEGNNNTVELVHLKLKEMDVKKIFGKGGKYDLFSEKTQSFDNALNNGKELHDFLVKTYKGINFVEMYFHNRTEYDNIRKIAKEILKTKNINYDKWNPADFYISKKLYSIEELNKYLDGEIHQYNEEIGYNDNSNRFSVGVSLKMGNAQLGSITVNKIVESTDFNNIKNVIVADKDDYIWKIISKIKNNTNVKLFSTDKNYKDFSYNKSFSDIDFYDYQKSLIFVQTILNTNALDILIKLYNAASSKFAESCTYIMSNDSTNELIIPKSDSLYSNNLTSYKLYVPYKCHTKMIIAEIIKGMKNNKPIDRILMNIRMRKSGGNSDTSRIGDYSCIVVPSIRHSTLENHIIRV